MLATNKKNYNIILNYEIRAFSNEIQGRSYI